MASLNKVSLIGNLGKDPEVRYMADGTTSATISLATTDKWKDKNTKEIKEHTEWHRVVFFNGLADVVRDYLKKGSSIYVDGKLRTNKWIDKQGIERYTTEIVASDMQMLGKKSSQEESQRLLQDEPLATDSMDMDSVPF